MLNDVIGNVAGNIWTLLSKEEELSVAQIKKKMDESEFIISAAIGWLARENKLAFKKSGSSIKIKLNG